MGGRSSSGSLDRRVTEPKRWIYIAVFAGIWNVLHNYGKFGEASLTIPIYFLFFAVVELSGEIKQYRKIYRSMNERRNKNG